MHGVCFFLLFLFFNRVGAACFFLGSHGGRVFTRFWVGWLAGPWNTCHAMPGAASRIKPFHAHDDTVVLHALMLCFWTLLLSILRTRHVSVFAFWPLVFPSKLRGGSPLFSICLDGDEPWAARIPHCDPSLYRLSMGLFKRGEKTDTLIRVTTSTRYWDIFCLDFGN